METVKKGFRELAARRRRSGGEDEEDFLQGPVKYISLKLFSSENAKQQFSMVSVLGMPPQMTSQQKLSYLSYVFDVEMEKSYRAAGALLSYLLKNEHIHALENTDEPVRLNRLKRAKLKDILSVDAVTLQALQIFRLDSHPLGFGSGKSKEGLSLYGLLNRTSCASGARLLKEWMYAPRLDVEEIQSRLDIIEALKSPVNTSFLGALQEALKGLKYLPGIISRIQTVRAGVSDWKNLHESARAIFTVVEVSRSSQFANEQLISTSLFKQLTTVDEDELRKVISWTASVVDFEESKLCGRVIVRDGFSEDIDELRRCLDGLDDFLTSIGVQEMQSITKDHSIRIPRLHVIYYPQIGYLILLDKEYLESDEANPTLLEGAGLEFMFSSTEHGYFKNAKCYELDKELGDIYGAVVDLENKAIRYLESKVLPVSPNLLRAHHIVTQFDCLLAMAIVAKENNWCKPALKESLQGYKIERGRHPLQEMIVPSFISNSTHAKGGDVHVVTGPNYSGKSVYLKQVAIIVFLSHIGSYVPAESAHIGLTDAIFTRILSLESASVSQSNFFIDCAQIARMVRFATSRSLVVIDEFGKGTNESDGISLLGATLTEFLKRKDRDSPVCLAATHFWSLLSEKYLPLSNPRLSTFSMEVLMEKTNSDQNEAIPENRHPGTHAADGSLELLHTDEKGIVYLYKLNKGSICVESQAVYCALRVGVPRCIIRRSLEIRESLLKGTALPRKCSPRSQRRMAQLAAAADQLLNFDLESDDPHKLTNSLKL